MKKIIEHEELVIELTPTESLAYDYVAQQSSEWLKYYEATIMTGRDKITQRLIASMYRENLVESYDHSEMILSHHLSPHLRELINSEYALFIHLSSQQSLLAQVTGTYAYDRVDIRGPFYLKDKKQVHRVMSPLEVLDLILKEDSSYRTEASEQFKDDLENSMTHMGLSLSYRLWTKKDRNQSLYDHLIEAQDPYLASEQAVIEGHPLHPGAKLRKGMSVADTIRYSSEFKQTIPLHFVLVKRSLSRPRASSEDYNSALLAAFPDLKTYIEEKLGLHILSDFVIFAVHPWQYQEIVLRDYQSDIEDGNIVSLSYSLPYYAGLSFRTLMPKYPDMYPHVKLPTSVHITGEIRTLSEQTTYNGPLMTQIIGRIIEEDPLFHQPNIGILDEFAGVHYYSPDVNDAVTLSEQLGTLFRNNLYEKVDLSKEELPVICSSLAISDVYESTPLIMSLIEQYSKSFHSKHDAIRQWFKIYAQALLNITLPLYLKYGIALEAHLQNTVGIFNRDGSLARMLVRDFEGLRIDQQQLAKLGFDITDFHEKSLILTDKDQTVFNKVFYSTLQNHLGELVTTIVAHTDYDNLEQELWTVIRELIKEGLEKIAETLPEETECLQSIRERLFAPLIDYKCVTTMRLEDEADIYTYRQVHNPLSRDK
ncbi:IucA/IucC family protein [Staphylococcus argensis]|uniref:Sialic acid synthase n=1 Tax=Staphylococcus argensis TaxID=1607738 RepID=A0A2K4FBT0_9STAP|nr:IucA/IucC family protein [Staphylococcus argensis]MCY6991875.1 sialic acid synthase [Staphylococcus argensis]POA08723.1 sialic acid synthase [Staphylococcus argensis]